MCNPEMNEDTAAQKGQSEKCQLYWQETQSLILHITLVHFSVAQEKSLCNEEYFLLCYSHGVCNNIISIKKVTVSVNW